MINELKNQASAVALIFSCLVFCIFGVGNFYNSLEQQLYEERLYHLTSISAQMQDKIETVAKYHWEKLEIAIRTLYEKNPAGRAQMIASIGETESLLGMSSSDFCVIDQDGRWYGSNGEHEEFIAYGDLISESRVNSIVTEDGVKRLLFLMPLEQNPAEMVGGAAITHGALMINVEELEYVLRSDAMREENAVYILDKEGNSLYSIDNDGVLGSGNLFDSLKSMKYLHEESFDNFISSMEKGEEAKAEVEIDGQNFFVVLNALEDERMILMIIPIANVSDNTNSFEWEVLKGSILLCITISVFILMIVAVFIYAMSQNKLYRIQGKRNLRLQEAMEKANEANMAKTTFLSRMSHDIRTPINGIMGMADIAAKNKDNPKMVENCMEKIQGAGKHLTALVNDVLDMSKLESGKMSIPIAPFNMYAVLDASCSIIESQLDGRNLTLVKQFENFDHPYVLGSELHLRRVLINILSNAMQYTQDPGTIIFSAREKKARDKAHFIITVEDTGVGMSPEYVGKVFEPFTQEANKNRGSYSSSYKGTGLGMAITKKIVDEMHGTITVDSEKNKGTKFTVDLSFDIAQNTEAVSNRESYRKTDIKGMKILVAEDNELNMEIVRYLIESEGAEAVCVTDGDEAVKAFEESLPGEFDAVLMDIMMQRMNGLEATRQIRGMNRPDAETIPIIAMTANAYSDDIEKAKRAGMNEHLAKPMDAKKLINAISYHSSCYGKKVV